MAARTSLRTLALFLFGIVVAAMLCLLAYFGLATWRQRVTDTLQRLQYQARLIATENNQPIADTREFIRTRLEPGNMNRLLKDPQCSAMTKAWAATRPRIAAIGLAWPDGRVVCGSSPDARRYDIHGLAYFQRALQSTDLVIGQAVIGLSPKSWQLPFAQTLRDPQGRPVAVLVASIDLAQLSHGLSGEVEDSGMQVGLFDASGRVLARYPDHARWVGRMLPPFPKWNGQVAAGTPFSGEEVGIDGVRQLFALVSFAQTAEGPVKLWLGVDKARAMYDIRRDLAATMTIALMLVAASAALIWFAWDRLLLRRLQSISQVAARLGRGERDARVADRRRDDEIGHLAQAIDAMADSLSSLDALTRANRALRVLTAGTAALRHATDEAQLIRAVCDAVATAGGYRLVWIGYADQGPDGPIRRVAAAGPAAAELGDLPQPWQDDSGGAVATALRDGEPTIIGPSAPCPCGVAGAASMLVLPLLASGKALGMLCICDRSGAFSADSLVLKHGLATEMGAIIAAQRARIEHGQMESSLLASEQRFRIAAEAMLDALLILDVVRDENGAVVDLVHREVNEAACRMLGTTRRDLMGRRCLEGNVRADPGFVTKCMQVVESGAPLEEEFKIDLPFIAAKWIRHQIVPMNDGVLVVARDITAAKQAEQALRESEQRWQFALEGAEQGVWDWDIVTQRAYYSPRLRAMYGLPEVESEDTGSDQWMERIHPDDRPAFLDAIQAHLCGETELLRAEYRLRKAGATAYGWMLTRGKISERDAEGRPTRLTGTNTDITAGKTAALELQASRELYRSLAEALPLGLCRIDMTGRVVFVNRALGTTLGFASPEKAIGHEIYDVSLGGDLDAARAADLQVLKSGEPLTRIEEYIRPHTKEKVRVETIRVPVRNAQGEIIGLQSVIRDVTDLLKAQEQQRLAALVFNSIHQGIVVTDSQGTILAVNRATERITGYGKEDIVGRRGGLFIINAGAELLQEIRSTAALTGYWEGRVESRRKNGEVFPQFITVDVLRDDAGEITNLVGLHTDISEAVRAEEKIRKLNEELEQRVEERTRALETVVKELEAFSYSVSHDLRAPLRGIDGFTRIIEQKYSAQLDDAGKGYLYRVRRGVDRMEQLIDDMLRLSRVTRQPVANGDVDLSRLARAILADLASAAPDRLVVSAIEDHIHVYGDAQLLRIALENLIGNAWKFTSKRETARIEIGTMNTAHGRAVFVRDNGAGFDMRYVDKLFVSFQRLHSITEYDGTGIGLAIVQRAINRHGGRVWAESAVGVGATFYFIV